MEIMPNKAFKRDLARVAFLVGGESGLQKVSLCGIRLLTRRYNYLAA
ncbi:DUF3265 domain-containing protein [Vibrio furnissii]|nr:DUF3265 domain-containing protein [Vibrio furnissii]